MSDSTDQPGVHGKPPEALHGILLMFSLIPAGLAALVGAAFLFYPIDNKLIRQMEAELSACRTAGTT
jgi:Na+/melibiose symporter-like transporter